MPQTVLSHSLLIVSPEQVKTQPSSALYAVVTARSLSVDAVTAAMFTAHEVVLIRPAPTHCSGQPNVIAQHAVASTIMRIDSVDSGRVNEKK
jgi:hypothetical protein